MYVDSLKTYNVPYDHMGGKYIFLDGMLPTQAGVFNSVAGIYALCRKWSVQDTLRKIIFKKHGDGYGYSDVKRAFEHYLSHFGGKGDRLFWHRILRVLNTP